MPNGDNGVFINGVAANNTIGGTSAAARNIISGNNRVGIAISTATNTIIQGNYIGTDITGNAIIANRQSGVDVLNTGATVIGGSASGAGNLISGNGSNGSFGVGINLSTGSADSTVQGNRIGTNAAGTAALPNANGGVNANSSNDNLIGGTAAGAGNLISGNGSAAGQAGNVGEGVGLFGTSTGNVIHGNLIGTNAAGTAALSNTNAGVILFAPNNIVGGSGIGARNVISGNGLHGIDITSGAGSIVLANFIGTDVTGTVAVPNASVGINVGAGGSNSSIGSPGAGNTIAFNSAVGVLVASSATGVAIRANSIHSNGGIGIDLDGAGITANDPGDGDSGANNRQNFPVITSTSAGSNLVGATLGSTPGTTFTLDFFANAVCDPSGNGEGQRYLGSAITTTDGGGNASFQFSLTSAPAAGEFVTATATDPSGNTSEFSACFTSTGVADLALTMSHTPTDPVVGQPATFTVTLTNNGPSAATGVVQTTTLPPSLSFVSVDNVLCAYASGVVSCNYPTFANGVSIATDIVATPNTSVFATVNASVSSAVADPTPANNTASQSSLILPFAPCSTQAWVGPTFYSVGSISSSVVTTGDYNEDGKIDTVSASQSFAGAALLLGNGAGGFAAPTAIALPAATTAVLTADLNHDNHADLVFALTTGVHVMLGDGLGNFTPAAGSPFATAGVAATTLEKGLFNADAHLDIVVGSSTGSNVALLLGNGVGGFSASSFPSGSNPLNVIVGDFNHDNKLDVAVPNVGGSTISVLNGNGLGSFAAPTAITVPNTVGRLREVGDVNRDGWIDLGLTTTIGSGLNNLMLLLNDQAGGFPSATEILGPVGAGYTQPSDFNGDGALDLAVVAFNGRMYVLYGDGTGAFPTQESFLVAQNQNALAIADFNGDHRPDIVGSRGSGNNVHVLLNTCGGGAVADLSVTLSGPASTNAGTHPNYTASITNSSATTATGVVLTELLPTGMTFESATSSGSPLTCTDQGTSTVSCNVPNVPANGSLQVDIHVYAFAAGTRINQVMAIAQQSDSDLGDNVASFTTTVNAAPITFVVSNTNDSGAGSLRQAITDSNLNAGVTNTINFLISGGGVVRTINLQSALPSITVPVMLDGWTQGGAGYTGPPLIELNGALAFPAANGINLNAGSSGSTVRGLAINRFVTGISVNGSDSAVIQGNFIGMDPAGGTKLPNSGSGVSINNNAANTLIGGTSAGAGNLIAGNGGAGINLNVGANGTQIYGNLIGTNAAGIAGLGNSGSGVSINSSSNVIVGSAAAGNIIVANAGGGVKIDATSQSMSGVQVVGNSVGVASTGAALGNTGAGLRFTTSGALTITASLVDQNLISGNTQQGITVENGVSGLQITRNTIGLNPAGTAAVGNGTQGINVQGATTSNITIGGSTPGAGNVISGNANGVLVGAGVTGTLIQGNLIGLNATGLSAIANRSIGVSYSGTGGTIGGTVAGARNVISGNGDVSFTGYAMTIDGSGVTVQGNYIGTDVNGTAAVPNADGGILIAFSATNNTIGGTTAGARNVISGNGAFGRPGPGILLQGAGTSNNLIQGNYIGTNAAGTGALPNTSHGINISNGSGNTVGGSTAGAGNLISGNALSGIRLSGGTGTSVLLNRIGTDASGTGAVGNGASGVDIDTPSNVIGNTTSGNTIAFNAVNGVRVTFPGTGNTIRGNSIFSNGALGIDLGADGVTANDAGDVDTGPNNLQNFPVITAAGVGSATVGGTLNSVASAVFTLDFYASTTCDPSGNGEGRRYLGSGSTTTNGSGNATFSLTLASALVAGELVTATATSASGNPDTSEFSACFTATGVADLALTMSHTPTDPILGQPVTFTLTTTNNGPSTATGIVQTTTLPASLSFTSVNNAACANASGVVTCNFPTLANGASIAVNIVATPNASVFATVNASVSSAVSDPTPANNTASQSGLILPFASVRYTSVRRSDIRDRWSAVGDEPQHQRRLQRRRQDGRGPDRPVTARGCRDARRRRRRLRGARAADAARHRRRSLRH